MWLVVALTGRTPQLRNSVTLRLDRERDLASGAIEQSLGVLNGVDEVTVLPKDCVAYLRVDESCFDPKQAHAVPGVLAPD